MGRSVAELGLEVRTGLDPSLAIALTAHYGLKHLASRLCRMPAQPRDSLHIFVIQSTQMRGVNAMTPGPPDVHRHACRLTLCQLFSAGTHSGIEAALRPSRPALCSMVIELLVDKACTAEPGPHTTVQPDTCVAGKGHMLRKLHNATTDAGTHNTSCTLAHWPRSCASDAGTGLNHHLTGCEHGTALRLLQIMHAAGNGHMLWSFPMLALILASLAKTPKARPL